MKKLLVSVAMMVALCVEAQKSQSFHPVDFTLHVPAFLPAIRTDSSAVLQHDTLIYSLKGMMFRNGGLTVSLNGNASRMTTPVETVTELVRAYARKDKKRIVDLYSTASKDKAELLFYGAGASEFLSHASRSVKGLKILAAIAYMDGYLVYVKDNHNRVHMNYVVKEGSVFKLSALNDSKPTSWNIATYFTYEPKLITSTKNVLVWDSLHINDSILLKVTFPQSGWWAAVFTENQEHAAPLLIQDNGFLDLNDAPTKLSFYLPGYLFGTPGTHTFYIAAFNYPVQWVSKNFFTRSGKYTITIYGKDDEIVSH